MATDHRTRSGGERSAVDATLAAGSLLAIVSLVWLVLTSIVVGGVVIDNVGDGWFGNLVTNPEGDARRGLFFAGVVLALEVGSLAVSLAVVSRRWWGRWVALAVAIGFGALTAYWLTAWAPPLLVANLATLAMVAALLTGSLVSHRDDRVFLWGERAPSAR